MAALIPKELVAFLAQYFESAFVPVPNTWLDFLPGRRAPFLTEYFSRQGKRLRPILLMSAYLMAHKRGVRRPSRNPKQILDSCSGLLWVANALERFHVTLMALDDLFDGGKVRRGGKALHLAFRDWSNEHYRNFTRPSIGRCFGTPSPRAFVLDIAIDVIADLLLSLAKAADIENPRLQTAPDGGSSLSTALSFSLHTSRWPKTFSTDGECVPLDFLLSHLQTIVDAVRMTVRQRAVNSGSNEVLDLAEQMLQQTLDGERMDIKWSGGTMTVAGERKVWHNCKLNIQPIQWPRWHVPKLTDVLANQYAKTSVYSIHFPLMVGALLADRNFPREAREAVHNFAEAFGRAFQINDDILLTVPVEQSGKSSLTDLGRHSATTVTVGAYELMQTREERERYLELLGRCSRSAKARNEVLAIIHRLPVKQLCLGLIRKDLAVCEAALQRLEALGYAGTGPLRYILEHGVNWMDDARTDIAEANT